MNGKLAFFASLVEERKIRIAEKILTRYKVIHHYLDSVNPNTLFILVFVATFSLSAFWKFDNIFLHVIIAVGITFGISSLLVILVSLLWDITRRKIDILERVILDYNTRHNIRVYNARNVVAVEVNNGKITYEY